MATITGIDKGFEVQCPFCSAPYTAEMLVELYEGGGGCDTCGPDGATVKIEIRCANCKKLVYAKEGSNYDF